MNDSGMEDSVSTAASRDSIGIESAGTESGIAAGLADFESYDELVRELGSTLNIGNDEVHRRLFLEATRIGSNVSEAASRLGVTPHVYNEAMEAFYSATDAFIFELATVHSSSVCQEIDERIARAVRLRHPVAAETRILMLGDGIGTDSLRFAAAGFNVSYFEFDGASSRFAKRRFERVGIGDRIQILHHLAELPESAFDVVINREVLEHVASPMEVIANIWKYLVPGGTAVITESFGRVEPDFPTHLASNLAYAGRTLEAFVERGFRVVEVYPGGRPVVFQKTGLTDSSRFATLPRPSFLTRLSRRLASIADR